MALEAVVGGTVTGEVLDGNQNTAFHHALIAVLVTFDQVGGDLGAHILTLAVGRAVTGPAGVGGQVDLGAVQAVNTLGPHDLTVILGIFQHGVRIAGAQRGSGNALRVGQAVGDGVGEAVEGHGHLAVGDGVVFAVLLQAVVEPDGNFRLGVGTQNEGAGLGSVQPIHIGSVRIFITAAKTAGCGEQQIPDRGTVLIHHISGGGADRAVSHDVDHLMGQLGVGKGCGKGLGTGLCIQTPVLEVIQFLVVVQIAEVLAILGDNTQQGDADGGAVLVLIEHGVQDLGGQRICVSRGVGGSNVAVLNGGLGGGAGSILRSIARAGASRSGAAAACDHCQAERRSHDLRQCFFSSHGHSPFSWS